MLNFHLELVPDADFGAASLCWNTWGNLSSDQFVNLSEISRANSFKWMRPGYHDEDFPFFLRFISFDFRLRFWSRYLLCLVEVIWDHVLPKFNWVWYNRVVTVFIVNINFDAILVPYYVMTHWELERYVGYFLLLSPFASAFLVNQYFRFTLSGNIIFLDDDERLLYTHRSEQFLFRYLVVSFSRGFILCVEIMLNLNLHASADFTECRAF